MSHYILIAAVVVAFLVILRIKARAKGGRQREPAVYARRIEGFQINAYLHPRVSERCLFDHGMQYGKGFRRKEGPQLPHDAECRCTSNPFSYTSTEVFNGALRNHVPMRSTIPGLGNRDGQRLIDALKQFSGQTLPDHADDYVARITGDIAWEGAVGEAVAAFLRERHAYLRDAALKAIAGASAADPQADQAGRPSVATTDKPEVVKS